MGYKISITCNCGAKKIQLHVIEWLKFSITVVYKRHSEWYSMKTFHRKVIKKL